LDTDQTFGVFLMAKYDEGFKRAVVQEYLSGSKGFRMLASQYGVDGATIRRWVEGYRQHGEAGIRRKYSRYDARFKLSVLQRMWREELTYRQVIALFDLRGGTAVVASWERRYHEGGLDALEPQPRGRPKKMTRPKSPESVPARPTAMRTLEELRKENECLRAEVAYLKKLDALVRAKQQAAPKKRKP
jgi:transposase